MKGQFFLFAGILIVLTIIFIRTLMISVASIPTSNIYFPEKTLQNLELEYENILRLSVVEDSPPMSARISFQNFTNSVRKFEDVEVLWIVFYGNSTNMNMSIGNFLKSSINLNIESSSTNPTSITASLKDGEIDDFYLSVTYPAIFNVSYTFKGEQRKEEFEISDESLCGFFDIKIKKGDFWVRNIYFKCFKTIVT